MKFANQKGISLVESMIALLVSSVSMISVAKMELVAKGSVNESIEHTAAAMYASEMVENMRANREFLSSYVGLQVGGGAVPSPSKNCESNTCTDAQLAEFDLWSWEQQLDGVSEIKNSTNIGGLTSPTACIQGPAIGGSGTYTVAIAWRGKVALKNPATHNCGDATGKYGAANEFRRVIEVQFYISSNGLDA